MVVNHSKHSDMKSINRRGTAGGKGQLYVVCTLIALNILSPFLSHLSLTLHTPLPSKSPLNYLCTLVLVDYTSSYGYMRPMDEEMLRAL